MEMIHWTKLPTTYWRGGESKWICARKWFGPDTWDVEQQICTVKLSCFCDHEFAPLLVFICCCHFIYHSVSWVGV